MLALAERLKGLDTQVTDTFRSHPRAAIIESLPGMGPILDAEPIAAAGDLNGYGNAGRLASAAGLVPVPRDSGRRTGNLHRPSRYSRKLRRVFNLSANAAMMREGSSRDYYLKKRSEGAKHVQALICLARQRIDVLWALGWDGRPRTRTEVPVSASRSARQRKASAEAGDLAVVRIDVTADDSLAYNVSCAECEVPRPGTGTRAWSTRRPGEDNGYIAAMDRWIFHLTAKHPDAEAPCLKFLPEARARLEERRDTRG